MSLTQETIDRASRMKIDAVELVLTHHRPAVHRIATALTGRTKTGASVTRHVLYRSLRFTNTWDDEYAIQRWFYHHTIVSARPYADQPPETKKDVLVPADRTDTEVLAFVKALRSLPAQQREAWILTNLEKLQGRQVATSMDCSLEASANHLAKARRALVDIAGTQYESLEAAVVGAYAKLTPVEDETITIVRSAIRRHVWPRRIKLMLAWGFTIALLSAIGWAAWKIYPLIDW